MQINVSSNYKKLSRSLDQVGRKQLPFAFAKTLNETMKAVEKYTVARTYPRACDVRNRAFFKASMFTGTAISLELRLESLDRTAEAEGLTDYQGKTRQKRFKAYAEL